MMPWFLRQVYLPPLHPPLPQAEILKDHAALFAGLKPLNEKVSLVYLFTCRVLTELRCFTNLLPVSGGSCSDPVPGKTHLSSPDLFSIL